jgi:ComF family protein
MNLLNPVLTVLFPVFCGVCSAVVDDMHDGAACSFCWQKTRLFEPADIICSKCGRFHSKSTIKTNTMCRRCDDDFYDTARSCGFYEFAIAETVIRLKKESFIAKRPANLLWEAFSLGPFSDIDLLIPVPLSKRRLFERSFNQAEVLARSLSKQSGIRVDSRSLFRNKHNKQSRAAMDRKGRAMSVRNAFDVRRPNLIRNKNILLMDDVFTSGATASMAAKALKKKGAARVDVLTLARAGINM